MFLTFSHFFGIEFELHNAVLMSFSDAAIYGQFIKIFKTPFSTQSSTYIFDYYSFQIITNVAEQVYIVYASYINKHSI